MTAGAVGTATVTTLDSVEGGTTVSGGSTLTINGASCAVAGATSVTGDAQFGGGAVDANFNGAVTASGAALMLR